MATVLVVDDESGIARLLDAILTDEGYNVINAINGKRGLEAMAAERPDLVFLDYMMPIMDGAGMLRGMAAEPAFRDTPIVMMSAMPEATVAEQCSGYVSFMRKPFRMAQVVDLAKRLLGS